MEARVWNGCAILCRFNVVMTVDCDGVCSALCVAERRRLHVDVKLSDVKRLVCQACAVTFKCIRL